MRDQDMMQVFWHMRKILEILFLFPWAHQGQLKNYQNRLISLLLSQLWFCNHESEILCLKRWCYITHLRSKNYEIIFFTHYVKWATQIQKKLLSLTLTLPFIKILKIIENYQEVLLVIALVAELHHKFNNMN